METNITPKSLDLVINPDGTAIYTLNEEGDISGSYRGTFVFKCYLSPLDTLAAGKLYRELLGSNAQEASDTERFIAFCLSQLSKRIIKSPPFWNTGDMLAGNIPDMNVLSLILSKAVESEEAYKTQLKEKRTQALETAKNAATALQERLNGMSDKDQEPK